MNTLTIQSLKLKNFKGIKDFTFSPCGKDISVFGDNATGKTTIIDAFSWILFNKDSHGKADFQLKPVDRDGHEVHHLDTEVGAIIEFNNKTITLKKRFQEKYTKKHGEAQRSFTGHNTDYFIDEVPAKKKEFDSKVAEIIDINVFKLVTNPIEFNNLHWTDRRQILLEMCGDVTDQDIIDSDSRLASLSAILGDCSIEDHKKKVRAKKRDINKELEQIPVRISENQEAVKDTVCPDPKEKIRLEGIVSERKEALRSLVSNEALSTKRVELNETNNKILTAQSEADKKQIDARKSIQSAIDKLDAERREQMIKVSDLRDQITREQKRRSIASNAINNIRRHWYEEDGKQPKNNTTCPTCGQDIPGDQISAAIERFNQAKAEKLEDINKEGVDLKEMIADFEKSIDAAKISIDAIEKTLGGIEKTIEVKKSDLENIYESVNIDDLDQKKNVLETEIAALMNGSTVQEKTAQRHIFETQEKLDEWHQIEASWKAAEKSRSRVIELEAQEKALAAEFERLESELFLIEKFIVAKVEMLEEKINNKFKLAGFKLFEQQINGGISECCETTYNGVSFNHGLNSAARINVGLDIINTLSEYYGFRSTVWIDNSESINEIIPMGAQVISLVVSMDKELTVLETEAQKAS